MGISPEEYQRKKIEAWQRRSDREYFVVEREFIDTTDDSNSYEHLVGTHNKLTLGETIESKTRTNTQVSVLDAGCGEGRFLYGVHELWKNKVHPRGITAYPYHLDNAIVSESVRTGAIEIAVESLDDYYAQCLHDVLASVYAIMYVFDPIHVLQNLYSSLKIGGVGFVYPFRVKFEDDREASDLQSYLMNTYQFEWHYGGAMSFTRTTDRLAVPVEITSIEKRHSASSSWQTVYKMRK